MRAAYRLVQVDYTKPVNSRVCAFSHRERPRRREFTGPQDEGTTFGLCDCGARMYSTMHA